MHARDSQGMGTFGVVIAKVLSLLKRGWGRTQELKTGLFAAKDFMIKQERNMLGGSIVREA